MLTKHINPRSWLTYLIFDARFLIGSQYVADALCSLYWHGALLHDQLGARGHVSDHPGR